jgi:HK97 family phage major capsid protein
MKNPKVTALASQIKVKAGEALAADKPEDVIRLSNEAEALRLQYRAAKTAADALEEMETVDKPPLPGKDTDDPAPGDNKDRVTKAVNFLRFGAEDDPTSVVMKEIYGDDYRETLYGQRRAFTKYLKSGLVDKALERQFWAPEQVVSMLKDGLLVHEIKTTMVEGQDTLGGYAVPPQIAAEVISRAAGLTVVRQAGATVVQTASKMIEWLKIAPHGSDTRYPTAITGTWGTETQSPEAKNFTYQLQQIPVHLYTYKFDLSQSLLEDADNVVQVFTRAAGDTLSIDEDIVFLTGDGAGKPYGILPGNLNPRSLNHVPSGASSTLTWQGVRNLRRGIIAQYRGPRSSFVMNSDAGKAIEEMTDGLGKNYVEQLNNGDRFLGGTYRESEAMSAISAGTFPALYGDFSGYIIVERLGLAIQRYNDSNTGINVVDIQLRRRIGGDLMESWKFAVQCVEAS